MRSTSLTELQSPANGSSVRQGRPLCALLGSSLLSTSLALSCASDAEDASVSEPEPAAAHEPGAEPEPEPEPSQEIDAEAKFALLCAPCHGSDLRGGNGGIDLTERLPEISDAEAFESIQHGVPPTMPAWSESLTVEETRAIIAYLRAEIE